MSKFAAFMLGMQEFRLSMTTRVEDRLSRAYDAGRNWAHRLTLRRYDNT
jgi:hypothetical protein